MANLAALAAEVIDLKILQPRSTNSMLKNAAKVVTLQFLRSYKWAISPMLPAACRYVPTCSEYAMEAVERYGALRGGWMALARLLRCHPLGRSGYDPVPVRAEEKLLPHSAECAPTDFTPRMLTR